jgi:hypothetical protein
MSDAHCQRGRIYARRLALRLCDAFHFDVAMYIERAERQEIMAIAIPWNAESRDR